jgi:glutamate racemase
MKDAICVFDSGVGGISVLRELVKIMPNEDFLFFGDSANAPYGTKSKEEVRRLTIDATKRFMEEGAKGVTIACNTATSAAVRVLREMYPDFPIVGIEPALKPAATEFPGKRILVLATPMTIAEEKFHRLLSKYEDDAEVIPLPAPGLMEFVENGKMDSPELMEFLEELLAPYKKGEKKEVAGVVLGCTHYPFVAKQIETVLGDSAKIFDGSEGTAREMRRRLAVTGRLRADESYQGRVEFRTSLEDPGKIDMMKRLLTAD